MNIILKIIFFTFCFQYTQSKPVGGIDIAGGGYGTGRSGSWHHTNPSKNRLAYLLHSILHETFSVEVTKNLAKEIHTLGNTSPCLANSILALVGSTQWSFDSRNASSIEINSFRIISFEQKQALLRIDNLVIVDELMFNKMTEVRQSSLIFQELLTTVLMQKKCL